MQKANVNLIEQEDLLYQQDSLIPKKQKAMQIMRTIKN